MAGTASVMFCQQYFLRKNKKKRDADYSALAPDVLWLEILQTLRLLPEGEACSIKVSINRSTLRTIFFINIT